jgi:hypothetical protein
MQPVEQQSHAPVINAPVHVVTRSAGSRRPFARRLVKARFPENLHSELLHGVAAQDAILELFERYDDFDSMARDAVDRRPRSK